MSANTIEPVELPLKAGALLRELEAMRAERPDDVVYCMPERDKGRQ